MHGVPPPPAVAAAGDSQEFPGQQLGSAPVQPFPLRSNPLRSTLTSRGWPTPFLFFLFFVFCFFWGGGGVRYKFLGLFSRPTLQPCLGD